MSILLKIAAPVLILAGGLAGGKWLKATGPVAPAQSPEVSLPLVAVQEVQIAPRSLVVESQGEVRAAQRSVLVAQVAARVTWLAPELQAGSLVNAGRELIRLDTTDYELGLANAEAQLAQAQAALQLEQAQADLARAEWADYNETPPPSLVAREPQLASAEARVSAAIAQRDTAQLQLQRCSIMAPYTGRIEQRNAELGSYATPGLALCSLSGVDRAEVELPIRLQDLEFLDLGLAGPLKPIAVELSASIGGQTRTWQAQLVRTQASLNPSTRMVHALAELDRPFVGPNAIASGLFVQARIQGKRVDGLVELPRAALRDDQTVLLADNDNRLRIRPVEVAQWTRESALIRSGLLQGERVILTPLTQVVEGMQLRIAEEAQR